MLPKDRYGWICNGPLCGGETKNRTFVWRLDLAECRRSPGAPFPSRRLSRYSGVRRPCNSVQGSQIFPLRVVQLTTDALSSISGTIAVGIGTMARSATLNAVFVSCTSLRLSEIVFEVESDIGNPVPSSDHAMAWYCLRAGVTDVVPDAGCLFERQRAPDQSGRPAPNQDGHGWP